MKKQILMLSLALMATFTSSNTIAQSCCQKPVGKGMKALAMNKSFKAAHEAPLPFSYAAEKGIMQQYKTENGADANVFVVPSDDQSDKVLIMVHEWWGLNDYIKQEAERWQKLLGGKVTVYAIDLYDGKVASTPDEAGKLMGGLDAKRGEAIIAGLMKKIGKDKSIATIGWCMGGTWSFNATLAAGSNAAGCVMYYGFPESKKEKINTLKADVEYIYGAQDSYIKKADVEQFGQAVKGTHHKFTMHTYDAVHAFANPSNPKFDSKSASEAQIVTLKFLKNKLKLD